MAGTSATRSEATVRRPTWAWVWATCAVLVALVVAGVELVVYGHAGWGVALMAVAFVVAVALWMLSRKVIELFKGDVTELMGATASTEGSGESALTALRLSSSQLSEEELARLERNHAEQSAATQAWFESMEPQLRDVEIHSEDCVRLVGRVLERNPGSDRWLIYVHGFGGGWKNGLGQARRFAEERACNILFVDMRAQGASEGPVVGAGWLERRDIVMWCHWLVQRVGTNARIVLLGSSMGAASVIMAAGEPDLPPQVRVAVSDSGYASFWGIAEQMVGSLASQGLHVPAHPLLDVIRLVFLLDKDGYDLALACPADAIAHSQVPVMIVQGAADTLVTPENGPLLADAADGAAAGEGHDLLVMPGAGHCCSALADPQEYYGRILAFVDRWL